MQTAEDLIAWLVYNGTCASRAYNPDQINMLPFRIAFLAALLLLTSPLSAEPWPRHTIDNTSRGADGVRLADANGDGRLDIATGWEEGGVIRVYLNPGPEAAAEPWPAVTVGEVKAAEDAVLVDLDGDGAVDVVSCCEGGTRSVYVHWAPAEPADYLDAAKWQTEAFPALAGEQLWMYALPIEIDGRHGIDLAIGSKGDGSVGWLQSPENPRELAAWKWHRLYDAGWIMSIDAHDMDGDGDRDLLVSDRKGKSRGLLWLEHPSTEAVVAGEAWTEHRIGAAGQEAMFLTTGDLGDGKLSIALATSDNKLMLFTRGENEWTERSMPNPREMPVGKGVAIGDLDGDGLADLVHSIENRSGNEVPGVMWTSSRDAPLTSDSGREWRDVSGVEGIKFDLLKLLDLDGDGDLDVIGCEERDNLGVFWYENPHLTAD